jgi:CRP/FNR family transcriptional regulator
MDASILKKIFIFSELTDDDLELINNFSRLKKPGKNDIIFFDTEPYLGFYIVIEGMVKIYKISKDGREHILHIVDKYNTFAEVPLFENAGEILEKDFRYPANASAVTDDTVVLLIPHRHFIQLMETNTQLCLRMIAGFAKRLRYLNNHIENITLKDVTKRVAVYLLDELNKNKKSGLPANTITLKISKHDLASYLGTIIETFSRTLKKLQEDNIIEVNGKIIKILSEFKLRELCE